MLAYLRLFVDRKSLPLWLIGIVTGLISGFSSSTLVAYATALMSHKQLPTSRTLAIMAALSLLAPSTYFVSQVLIVHLAQKVTGGMLLQLTRSILAAPLLQLEQIGRDRILTVVTDDVYAIARGFAATPDILLHASVLVGCFVYLAWMSAAAFLWVLVFLALVMFVYAKAHAKAMQFMRLSLQHRTVLARHIGALTTGTKELKLHQKRRSEFLYGHLESALHRYFKHNLSAIAIYTAVSSGYEFMFWMAVGLIAFVLFPWLKLPGSIAISFGLILIYMLREAAVLAHATPTVAQMHVRLESVRELGLSLGGSSTAATAVMDAFGSWKSIDLVNVIHDYASQRDEDGFRLGPISMSLHPAEIVFVIGGNGSGKTTLAKILAGLYVPSAGEIWVDDHKIEDQNRSSYSELFSAVFSDFYLFESLLGLDDPDRDSKAGEYLASLGLTSKVNVRDGRFSTLDLSQGQRKRLALLVSFMENRSICIFDEWAADQDPSFREYFYRTLLPELREAGKCIVIISHDERYYDVADRIIGLEYGVKRFEKLGYNCRPAANEAFV